MNVTHVSRGITFEWDRYKASSNLYKHGISFKSACEIFFDPFVSSVDDEYVDGELREQIIGILPTWPAVRIINLRPRATGLGYPPTLLRLWCSHSLNVENSKNECQSIRNVTAHRWWPSR